MVCIDALILSGINNINSYVLVQEDLTVLSHLELNCFIILRTVMLISSNIRYSSRVMHLFLIPKKLISLCHFFIFSSLSDNNN